MYLLETSKIASLLKILWIRYSHIKEYFDNSYKNSQTHLLINAFDNIKIFLRYSFLGRITEIREKENAEIINNSRIMRYWMNLLRSRKNLIGNYSNTSRIMASARAIGKEVGYRPIKMGSIIVVSATVVSMALSFLLKREIDLFGWLMRGLFLFIGINGLFCNTDWLTLKNNGIILRLIRIWRSE